MLGRPSRLITACAVAITLAVGPFAAPAFGWSNGPARAGVRGNGYGTHDWVLDQAVVLAGSNGAWLDVKTARLHTDDPDFKAPVNQLNHIYNLTRTGCGGPQTVADLYHKAVVAYGKGDVKTASMYVGLLSHYYADLCQPYHTYRNDLSRRLAAEHRRYELAVDRSHSRPTSVRGWIVAGQRTETFDVRARAVSAALAARKDYPALKSAFRRHGYSSSSKSTVGRITRRRLSRASNDLADIIASIPTASGAAATPHVASVTPSQRTPRRSANVAVKVKLVDEQGQPVRGARVRYSWRIGGRTVRTTSYTGANGVATSWRSMGGASPKKRVVISVKSTTNSVETTGSTYVTVR